MTAHSGGQSRLPLDRSTRAAKPLSTPICSNPLPTIRTELDNVGRTNVIIEDYRVGNESLATALVGSIHRSAVTRFHSETDQYLSWWVKVRTPCEVLIHDLLVYEGTLRPTPPRVFICSDQRNVDNAIAGRPFDTLGISETITHLGKGPSVLHTPDVPRYPELARFAIQRMGWDPEKFNVYRCRVEYPVMPSSVVVQFDLPEPPLGSRGC